MFFVSSLSGALRPPMYKKKCAAKGGMREPPPPPRLHDKTMITSVILKYVDFFKKMS
jgi:hypothetical protein